MLPTCHTLYYIESNTSNIQFLLAGKQSLLRKVQYIKEKKSSL